MNEKDIILSVIENLNRLKTMNEEDRQMLIENMICDLKVLVFDNDDIEWRWIFNERFNK